MLIADVLGAGRPRSTDPDAIVEAIQKTNYAGGLMQYAGRSSFNEIGDNPNAFTTMIQILGQKPVAVWPKDAARAEVRVPRPKGRRLTRPGRAALRRPEASLSRAS